MTCQLVPDECGIVLLAMPERRLASASNAAAPTGPLINVCPDCAGSDMGTVLTHAPAALSRSTFAPQRSGKTARRQSVRVQALTTGTGGKKVNKVVLAYSGGLDTSVILKWLQETYDCEVVTFTADLGQVSADGSKFGHCCALHYQVNPAQLAVSVLVRSDVVWLADLNIPDHG